MRRLADVVQLGSEPCPSHVLGGQLEANGGAPGECGDLAEVIDEVSVLLPARTCRSTSLTSVRSIAPPGRPLVRVQELVGDVKRLFERDSGNDAGGAERAPDPEPFAALAEGRPGRALSRLLSDTDVVVTTNSSPPIRYARPRSPTAAASLLPSRASRASPAG